MVKRDLDLQLVWRYNAALDDGNEQVHTTEKLSSYSLFDFSGRYQINDNLALTVGIRNMRINNPSRLGRTPGVHFGSKSSTCGFQHLHTVLRRVR